MKHLVEATVTEKLLAGIPDPEKRRAQQEKIQTFGNSWQGIWLYYNAEAMQAYLEELGLVRKAVCGNATLIGVEAKTVSDAAIDILLRDSENWYKDGKLQWINECKALHTDIP